MKVKMLRQPQGKYENKPFPAAGKVGDFSDDVAGTLVRFKYAEPVEAEADGGETPDDEKPDNAPEDGEPETADVTPDETRDEAPKPAKRGPGRPRKTTNK